ncbi:hypothetical protein AOL_s00088g28 [Orbilia oligospora ATCC 24927]|uniref:Uncharacterized protein n=2 Tax=Orbilia oligospora TaxID=2813651 RepID=G1XHR5_ARTOA|nr:hypothetical protein AOL_s00088g28 [Orbilia oligospora ATCC 24927]EGX47313.1 hypothetical protein AOL_s00088g28 [Orbilia oligospora ATCC 24927]KAF3270576.1 hypothetical protein TWF970_010779 [Orbilia oligospora]
MRMDVKYNKLPTRCIAPYGAQPLPSYAAFKLHLNETIQSLQMWSPLQRLKTYMTKPSRIINRCPTRSLKGNFKSAVSHLVCCGLTSLEPEPHHEPTRSTSTTYAIVFGYRGDMFSELVWEGGWLAMRFTANPGAPLAFHHFTSHFSRFYRTPSESSIPFKNTPNNTGTYVLGPVLQIPKFVIHVMTTLYGYRLCLPIYICLKEM